MAVLREKYTREKTRIVSSSYKNCSYKNFRILKEKIWKIIFVRKFYRRNLSSRLIFQWVFHSENWKLNSHFIYQSRDAIFHTDTEIANCIRTVFNAQKVNITRMYQLLSQINDRYETRVMCISTIKFERAITEN